MFSMNDFIFQRQKTIIRFLDSDLGKNPFSVSPDVKWHAEAVSHFDILIHYKSIYLAVVEITQSLQEAQNMELAKMKIGDAFHVLNCHFGIITDNSDYYICEINSNKYHKYDFDSAVNYIINHQFIHDLIYKQDYTNISSILNDNKLDDFVERLQRIDSRFSFSENDETNFDDIYTRNFIRLKLLPMLEEKQPKIRQHILNLCKQVQDIFEEK